ncbi:4Fe-4S binding protein [bacterium]
MEKLLSPFSSPLYTLSILLLISVFNKKNKSSNIKTILIYTILFFISYILLNLNSDVFKWLARLNNPIILLLNILVLPSIFLARNKWYKLFLLLPALLILSSLYELFYQYTKMPSANFMWFLMRPFFVISLLVSSIVLIQPFIKLETFRRITRISMLLLLVYGGFMFRQSYTDYNEMIARRATQKKDILALSETTPVMQYENKLVYVPSAPCRFSAEGGYIQGCVMELLQRFMQINLIKVNQNNKEEIALLAIALAAILTILILLFIGARWWCGWICPLSTLGDAFDTIRRWIKLPHFKILKNIKYTYFYSGITLGSLGLLLAKGYAHVDKNGQFMGCKIPLYPFCKICPGQQVCPVAAKGLDGYPPLAGKEWLFGFFKYFAILLLIVFLIGFITSRRLWCYFCPMGIIGGFFNKKSLISLNKDSQKCNQCGTCNHVCPMDIHKVQKEMTKTDATSFDCVLCLNCIDNCPQNKCLSLKFANKKIIESNFLRKNT